MKLIKQLLSVSSLFITVASATLQNDVDNHINQMCPHHSKIIAYENADTHTLLPTGEVVTMIMNYNWPSDANFSILLDSVGLRNKVGLKFISDKIRRDNFAQESWGQDFLTRSFEFAIYPSNVVEAPQAGFIVITESKTKKYGTFFDVLGVTINSGYENRGLASKGLDAVLQFLDLNPVLGCHKLSILPGSDNKKIGLIYGRQGFWPYIRFESAQQLVPMSLTDTSKYFFDKFEYANWVKSENPFAKVPIMVRHAGADTLPLRGADTQQEILTKLQQIV